MTDRGIPLWSDSGRLVLLAMAEPGDFQRHSFDGLLTAVEYGDPSAREALKKAIFLMTAGRDIVVERHPQDGWRVRDPLAGEG